MEKFRKKRAKATTIALVLMLTFAATLNALPNVSTHDPPLNYSFHFDVKNYRFLLEE